MNVRHRLAGCALFLIASQTIAADIVTVVDSNGAVLGAALNADEDTLEVPFKVGKRKVVLELTPYGFVPGTLYFTSNDCSGTPRLQSGSGRAFFSEYEIGPPGNTLYLRDDARPIRTVEVRSVQNRDGCFGGSHITDTFAVAVPIVDLNTLYTPPFRAVLGPSVQTLPSP